MKAIVLAVTVFLIAAAGGEPTISYFSQARDVNISAPEKQNYAVLDSDVFQHARPDLADLRLLDGQTQVPYVLVKQSGGSNTQEGQAKILNLGSVGGRTEFDLDASGFEEYDRVRLELSAKDFINSAQVEGRRTLKESSGTKLGSSTLYDFTKEGLGANFTLKFSSASFSFLHIRLAPGISPSQVKGAYLSSFSESKSAWTSAGQCVAVSGSPRRSIYECSAFGGMPLERIVFEVPPATINFNRTVILSDKNGNEFQRSSITRVRVNRGGQSVTSEDLDVDVYSFPSQQVSVVIENGDDPALPVTAVRPLAVERRVYFDPKGQSSLQFYYGDPKLEAPSYDYAKFFHAAADAVVAQLGLAHANPQFTGRPDDRPWSERHSYVLWGAMVLAVLVLGGLALRGLKRTTTAAR